MTIKFANTGFIERLLNLAIHRMAPPQRLVQDNLSFWRVKILATILLTAAAFCLLVIGAGIFLVVKENLWPLVVVDIGGYAICIALLFLRGPGYEARAIIALITFYGVGVAIILSVGPLSGGPIYLFACAVIAGILLGFKAAITTVGINTLTLITLCWLISNAYVGQNFPFFQSIEAMIAAVASFIVLNGITATSISVLVKGLHSSHHKEKFLINRLEKEREALIAAKERLEVEIEERKQAEEALRAGERKYRLLADNASDIIWTMDPSLQRLTYVSPSVNKIRGFTQEEALAMPLQEILTPSSLKKVAQMFHGPVLKHNEIQPGQFFKLEVEMYKKDGSTLWTELSISFVRESEDKPMFVLGITRDISERKRAEQERADLEAQLRQARKMEAIGTLAGGIAHDFNNILSAIIGFSELCLDDAPKESLLNENLQEILNAGIRAKELVKQILTFARQSDDELKPIQASVIIKEALKLIRSIMPTTIQIESSISNSALILGTPTQLHQIIMNLCTNAAQAMEPDGGTLSVRLEETLIADFQTDTKTGLHPGRYLQLTVADTGSGITPEIMGSIFDPYFTTKPVGKGTGMGLAVVHGIVDAYGGKILVDSDVGKGTTFTIYFPIHHANATQAIQPMAQPQSDPGGHERILLVDDEPSILNVGGRLLERLGYTVKTLDNSLEALALFRRKATEFDLVITDLSMPNMTGVQLAKEIRATRTDIPILVCTGYSDWMSADAAAKLGIGGFIYKPIVKQEMAQLVRKSLDMASI